MTAVPPENNSKNIAHVGVGFVFCFTLPASLVLCASQFIHHAAGPGSPFAKEPFRVQLPLEQGTSTYACGPRKGGPAYCMKGCTRVIFFKALASSPVAADAVLASAKTYKRSPIVILLQS